MNTLETTVLESLNAALLKAMEQDERVFLLGEDLLDPYGGAFKVARGLSTRFPERILTTPISEAAIMGLANGMALRGLRPVAEIMFGDFVTLIADQLVNHAAKFRWMYQDQVRVPLVVRTPMGGYRSYGPTHSQSLEKLFLGVPGIRVVAVNTLTDPGGLLLAALTEDDPVVFIEHKLLYPRRLQTPGEGSLMNWNLVRTGESYPTARLHMDEPAHVTIACYGYMAELALEAANRLVMEREIFCELVVFSQLSPFLPGDLETSLKRTRKLLTVEEGTRTLGWGAEIAALAGEAKLAGAIARVAARDLPIATSGRLEQEILPSVDDIVQAAIRLADE